MIESPCLGCTDRAVGCHSRCDKYAAYRAEVDKVHAEKIKRRDNDYVDYSLRKISKMQRLKNEKNRT